MRLRHAFGVGFAIAILASAMSPPDPVTEPVNGNVIAEHINAPSHFGPVGTYTLPTSHDAEAINAYFQELLAPSNESAAVPTREARLRSRPVQHFSLVEPPNTRVPRLLPTVVKRT